MKSSGGNFSLLIKFTQIEITLIFSIHLFLSLHIILDIQSY
jgi:hypothetical protein